VTIRWLPEVEDDADLPFFGLARVGPEGGVEVVGPELREVVIDVDRVRALLERVEDGELRAALAREVGL
jgi:hypothetical protein